MPATKLEVEQDDKIVKGTDGLFPDCFAQIRKASMRSVAPKIEGIEAFNILENKRQKANELMSLLLGPIWQFLLPAKA